MPLLLLILWARATKPLRYTAAPSLLSASLLLFLHMKRNDIIAKRLAAADSIYEQTIKAFEEKHERERKWADQTQKDADSLLRKRWSI